ncbi:hypothetical protein [Streptomyces sp. NPDC091383]|uniref:hypothetical protein n=1 Tax=Streptomyces sp. NPDC091383 TaxID=3365996 RepID=UPI00382ED056
MSESFADRSTASTLTRGHEALARDARSMADTLTYFAKDVERGLRCGDINQLAARMQALLVLATTVAATRETAELYTAERDA